MNAFEGDARIGYMASGRESLGSLWGMGYGQKHFMMEEYSENDGDFLYLVKLAKLVR